MNNFVVISSNLLEKIAHHIEDHDSTGNLDVDYSNEVLKVTAPKGIFILNKQSSVEEIWLASPISGPHHFAQKNGMWVSSKNVELISLLNNELGFDFNFLRTI